MPRPPAVYNRRMTALESGRYHRLQLLLGLARLVLGAAFLAAVLLLGGGRILAGLAARVTASAAGQVALVAAALGAGHALLGVPFAWLSSWVLPRRYGLLHQPFPAWLADRAKAAALGAAIGLAGVEVVYALLRLTPLWWLGAAALAVALAIAFWVASHALSAGVGRFGYAGVADPAGLPWLALVLAALGLLLTPLVNAFSRHVERQADDFALALTRDPDGFIGAMERLAALNLAERRPHPLKEALLFSHPALDRRIARARAVA